MRRRRCLQQQWARTLRSPLSISVLAAGLWGCKPPPRVMTKSRPTRGRKASERFYGWRMPADGQLAGTLAISTLIPVSFSRDASRIALDSRVAFVVFACCAVAELSGFPKSRYRVRLRQTVVRFFSGDPFLNSIRRCYATRRLLLTTTRRRRPVRGGSKRDCVT